MVALRHAETWFMTDHDEPRLEDHLLAAGVCRLGDCAEDHSGDPAYEAARRGFLLARAAFRRARLMQELRVA